MLLCASILASMSIISIGFEKTTARQPLLFATSFLLENKNCSIVTVGQIETPLANIISSGYKQLIIDQLNHVRSMMSYSKLCSVNMTQQGRISSIVISENLMFSWYSQATVAW